MRPTANDIVELLAFFAPHRDDNSTFQKLQAISGDTSRWKKGHALFSEIRVKMLKADETNNERLQHQYSLDEICAKTLFNMSEPQQPFSAQSPAPFDEDSSDFVGLVAKQFASYFQVSSHVLQRYAILCSKVITIDCRCFRWSDIAPDVVSILHQSLTEP